MFITSFIVEPGQYNAEFHRLNGLIDLVAKSLPGFLGAESWQSADGSRINATYYWDSLETLKEFSTHPAHQEAKMKYAQWYDGYQIVISEVIRSYGDGAFVHVTPNNRLRTA